MPSEIKGSSNFDSDNAGKVLQVVSFAFTGDKDTTAQDNTFVDTGLTVNITPTSTSSKILVLASIGKIGSVTAGTMYNLRIVRDSTNILLGNADGAKTLSSAGGATTLTGENASVTMNYLDSPATTSETTYKVTYSGNGGEAVRINYSRNDDNSDAPSAKAASTITVMEIGA
jgi:3D (Asp-Asp-Asp) domain-containing protein